MLGELLMENHELSIEKFPVIPNLFWDQTFSFCARFAPESHNFQSSDSAINAE